MSGAIALSTEQVKRLERYVSKLPSKKVLKLVQNADLRKEWLRINNHAQLLGRCIAVRFSRQDGDPIQYLLQSASKTDIQKHELIWMMVRQYETLLSLIQMCWEPLSQFLKSLQFLDEFSSTPRSGFALFLAVLEELFNASIFAAVDGYKLKSVELEKNLRLFRDASWNPKKFSDDKGLMTQLKAAAESAPGVNHTPLYMIVYAVCLKEGTKNAAIASLFKEFCNLDGAVADLLARMHRQERAKHGPYSIKWEEQRKLYGRRNGQYA